MTPRSYRIAIVLSVIATALPAQTRPFSGPGVIRLTLNDSGASPLSKPFEVWVTVPGQPRTGVGTSFGARHMGDNRYVIEGLPDERVTVRVACPPLKIRAYDRSFEFDVRRAVPLDTTITVDRDGCDPREIRNETRLFSGFYTPGENESRFVPCTGDSWVVPSDSLRTPADSLTLPKWMWEPSAWVSWDATPPGFRERLSWPKIEHRDQWGNATYFVRWRGTMTGPDHYGHMGASEFEFKVDRVVAIEKPTPSSCELKR